MQPVVAAVLSVGTELTEGSTQDTHGRYISELLHRFGVRTCRILLIPDDVPLFREELSRLVGASDLVIITGGLGPTSDDLTRETVASVGNLRLDFHETLWRAIEARFRRRTPSVTNRKQALIPAGFTPIRNPHGTAPGFWGRIRVEEVEALLVALPGPPRELRPLMNDEVLPVLLREFRMRPPEELRATVFLLSESLLEQFLQETRTGSVKWGTRAEAYRIVLILRGGSREERETIFAALERRVGWQRVRYGEVEAQALVVDALRACSSVLIAAESCTGGLVGKLITDVPGASEIFWGSLVAYSNQAKGSLLGVPEEVIERHGAVSAQTVSAMARGAIELSNADFSCSISGIAGPGGGTPEKPVGTVWIGVGRNGGRTWELLFHFSGDRDMVRRKAALASLLMSETTIRGKEVDNIELWQYI